jgi:hypothetical protein
MRLGRSCQAVDTFHPVFFCVGYNDSGLVAKRIAWRSQRLTCGKLARFALLTRADQGGAQLKLTGACQSQPPPRKHFHDEGWIIATNQISCLQQQTLRVSVEVQLAPKLDI